MFFSVFPWALRKIMMPLMIANSKYKISKVDSPYFMGPPAVVFYGVSDFVEGLLVYASPLLYHEI